MQKLISFLICFIFLISCKTEEKKGDVQKTNIENNQVQLVKSLDYESLKPLLNLKDDKTYVVNFWATWCEPCVAELPAFEKLGSVYKSKNVDVILVSLDNPKQLEKRLIPFIEDNNLQSKVLLMNDPDQNAWIPKVNKEWSGTIPATLIYNKSKRAFYERSFTYKELEIEVKKFTK